MQLREICNFENLPFWGDKDYTTSIGFSRGDYSMSFTVNTTNKTMKFVTPWIERNITVKYDNEDELVDYIYQMAKEIKEDKGLNLNLDYTMAYYLMGQILPMFSTEDYKGQPLITNMLNNIITSGLVSDPELKKDIQKFVNAPQRNIYSNTSTKTYMKQLFNKNSRLYKILLEYFSNEVDKESFIVDAMENNSTINPNELRTILNTYGTDYLGNFPNLVSVTSAYIKKGNDKELTQEALKINNCLGVRVVEAGNMKKVETPPQHAVTNVGQGITCIHRVGARLKDLYNLAPRFIEKYIAISYRPQYELEFLKSLLKDLT